MGRSERPIKLGDSSYSPKSIWVLPGVFAGGGRATGRMRGLRRLSSPVELRMPPVHSPGERGRVLTSVPERRTILTAV